MSKKQLATALVVLITISSTFAQSGNRELPAIPQYGANILRVAPVTAMDIGVGFGISYERFLDKRQMVGLVFPVSMLLENKKANNGGGKADHLNSPYNTYVYFMPGVKLYPFGQRKVTYAIGPSLMLGYGGGSDWQYRTDLYGMEYLDAITLTRWRLGLLVNNYVNFQLNRHLNFGFEGGLGLRYLDKTSYSGGYYAGNSDANNGVDITGQFSLTLGYRF